jgi:predicted PurR-regulated permease PerM
MAPKNLSLHNIAYFLVIALIGTLILIEGKFFIIPFFFAILLSVIVLPIQHFYDRFIKTHALSTILTFFTILLPLTAIVGFFSFQVSNVLSNLSNISGRLQQGTDNLFLWLSQYFHISVEDSQNFLKENISGIVASPISVIQSTFSSFGIILLNIVLIILFMFFMLSYRIALKNFMLMQFEPMQRSGVAAVMVEIQKMLRQYLNGLLSVMIILAVLNSLGLWIIGVEYPILWASLAAFLTIIPYIGTTLGGGLPFFYALATAESWQQPAAVILMYVTVQQIEGNLITPYVVGSRVRINPLIAIIAILLMNELWGVSGIVLAIPVAATIKIIFDRIAPLKAVGTLMSSNIIKDQDKFLSEYNESRFRFSSLLLRRNKEKEDNAKSDNNTESDKPIQ